MDNYIYIYNQDPKSYDPENDYDYIVGFYDVGKSITEYTFKNRYEMFTPSSLKDNDPIHVIINNKIKIYYKEDFKN